MNKYSDILKRGVDATLYPLPFKKGGKIQIKPENRGKFTAYAKSKGMGVQEAASSVLKNPDASPTLKKRANFARNAAGWKKEQGGILSPRSFAPPRQLDFNQAVKMAMGGKMKMEPGMLQDGGMVDPEPKPINRNSPRFGADLSLIANYGADTPIWMLDQHNKPNIPGRRNTPSEDAIRKGYPPSIPEGTPMDSLINEFSPEQLKIYNDTKNRLEMMKRKTKFSPNQP